LARFLLILDFILIAMTAVSLRAAQNAYQAGQCPAENFLCSYYEGLYEGLSQAPGSAISFEEAGNALGKAVAALLIYICVLVALRKRTKNWYWAAVAGIAYLLIDSLKVSDFSVLKIALMILLLLPGSRKYMQPE